MTAIGSYWEDTPSRLITLEGRWGFRCDMARAAQWTNGWNDTTSSYMVQRIRDNLQPRLVQHMAVPWPSGGSWAAAAQGQYNSYYTQFAKNLLSAMPSYQKSMYIGYSYETNGGFWYCTVRPEDTSNYRAASRHFHNCLKAEGDKVGFDFIVMLALVNHNSFSSPACSPYDMFVPGVHRAIGLNCYVKPFYHGGTLDSEWSYWADGICGLKAMKKLADDNNCAFLLPEIGINSCGWSGVTFNSTEKWDIEPFMAKLGDWCIANNVTAALHWDSDKDYPGDVYKGNMPKGAAATTRYYQRLKAAQTGAVVVPPPPASSDGGTTLPPPVVYVPNPYDAAARINAATYNKSSLTAAEIAQINQWSYDPLVASGRKTDASYPVPPLALGDVTAADAARAKAEAEVATLKSSLATTSTNLSNATAQLSKASTDLIAARAATVTAQTSLTTAQGQVTTLTAERNAAVTARTAAETDRATAETARAAAVTALNAEKDKTATLTAQLAAAQGTGGTPGTGDPALAARYAAALVAITRAADVLRPVDPAPADRKARADAAVGRAKTGTVSADQALEEAVAIMNETTA